MAQLHAYYLAGLARRQLGLGDRPVDCLRDLAEVELGIPVIQTTLGRGVAGATIDAGGDRAIVLNVTGKNVRPRCGAARWPMSWGTSCSTRRSG